MNIQALLVLFAAEGALSALQYSQDVSDTIEEFVPFRLVCSLNTSVEPYYDIRVYGFTGNNSFLFYAFFTGAPSYQMTVSAAGGNITSQTFPEYTILISDYNVPQVPAVMILDSGRFALRSAGKGVFVYTPILPESVKKVTVQAFGKNIVDCTQIECYDQSHGSFAPQKTQKMG